MGTLVVAPCYLVRSRLSGAVKAVCGYFFLNLRGNTCIVCVVVLVSELSENRPISSLYASAFKARFNKDENIS